MAARIREVCVHVYFVSGVSCVACLYVYGFFLSKAGRRARPDTRSVMSTTAEEQRWLQSHPFDILNHLIDVPNIIATLVTISTSSKALLFFRKPPATPASAP